MDSAFKAAGDVYDELSAEQRRLEEDLRRLLGRSARDAEPLVPLRRSRLRRLHAGAEALTSAAPAAAKSRRKEIPRLGGAFHGASRRSLGAGLLRRVAPASTRAARFIASSSDCCAGCSPARRRRLLPAAEPRRGRRRARAPGIAGAVARACSSAAICICWNALSTSTVGSLPRPLETSFGKAMIRPTMMIWMMHERHRAPVDLAGRHAARSRLRGDPVDVVLRSARRCAGRTARSRTAGA